jgi:hypothetical protein
VDVANGDNLVDERVDGRTAAVDDALSADLDYRRVRQDPEVRRRIRRYLELRVGQRSLHEERFKLHRRVRHGGALPFVSLFQWSWIRRLTMRVRPPRGGSMAAKGPFASNAVRTLQRRMSVAPPESDS